ncbi:ArnT family glycosyltransferase [Candidatus Poribacteria bacterium]
MIALDFLLLLVLALAAFGIGSLISGRLYQREDMSAAFSWGISTALGLGCLSLFTFLLGICRLLYWWLSLPVLLIAAVYGGLSLYRLLSSRLRLRWSISLVYIIPTLLVIALIALVILDYLAPANQYDDLKYHISLPRRYAESHKLYPFSTTFHSYWPGNLEMLITQVMMLGTDSAGRGVLLLMTLSLAGILAGFTRQIFRDFSGAVPAILLFTLPTVFSQIRVASTDLAGSFWMLGAIALIVLWLHDPEPGFCLLSGAFMGFAIGTKYNFMYETATVFLITFFYGILFQRPFLTAKNIKTMLLSISIAIVIASPWYVRNWILMGNPVYPFYYSLFGGKNWSAGLDREFMVWLKSDYARLGLRKVPSSLLRSGFRVFYLLPLSLIACRRRKQILIISLGLFLFLAWYYLGTYQLRFGITWQILLTLAIAFGLLEATRYWRGSHFAILLILCALFAKQLPSQYRSVKPRIDVVLGRQSREEYLANYPTFSNTYPLIDYANKDLPDGTVLATFWYNAGHYHSRHEYFMLNPLISGVIDHTAIESPEDYAASVINTGATHLIYATDKAKYFIAPPRTKRYYKLHNWHKYFVSRHTKLLKQHRDAFLYEIIPEAEQNTDIPEVFHDPTYSTLPFGDSDWKDYTIECDVIFPGSANISCAGLLVRYDTETGNGMRFWVRNDNPSAQFSFWHDVFRHIWQRGYPVKSDVKYSLKVTVKGDLYSCFINGKLVTEHEDRAQTFRRGTVGLITYGTDLSIFDKVFSDIRINGSRFATPTR